VANGLSKLAERWPALFEDSGQTRPVASYRTNLITVLLGGWFTVGLFLDAWAHNNVPGLETFFTPWHAVFYSGFAATAGWILWIVAKQVQAGRKGIAAVPLGYAAALVALPGFALAGAGDLLWHTIFGIEQEIKILFSPTHLGLIGTMVLIVTAPLRAAWSDRSTPAAPSLRELLPAVLSLAFATTLVMLILQYGNALAWSARGIVEEMSAEDGNGFGTLAIAILVTNLMLLAPLLTLARRWVVPFGTATILYAAAALLAGAIRAFGEPGMVIALIVAGAFVDLLARGLRPTPARIAAYRAFAALAALVTWTLYIAMAALTHGQGPTVVELWSGAPIVQALLGLLLAVLLVPSAPRDEVATR
jgi:hypothetical protein